MQCGDRLTREGNQSFTSLCLPPSLGSKSVEAAKTGCKSLMLEIKRPFSLKTCTDAVKTAT